VSTFTVGRGRVTGSREDFAMSCGGCGQTYTLPPVDTARAARREARREGHTYREPWGWLCASCVHGWAAPPRRRAPEPVRPDPRRRVTVVVPRPRSRCGRFLLAPRGEHLECGHVVIHPGGDISHNRTRRCPECGSS